MTRYCPSVNGLIGKTPVVVLSRNSFSFPSNLPNTVSHSSETAPDLVERFSAEGVKRM
jgi:hypothetical protein